MQELRIRLTEEQQQRFDKVKLITKIPNSRIVRNALSIYYEIKPFKIEKTSDEGVHKKGVTLMLDEHYYSQLKEIAQAAGVPTAIAARQILVWYLKNAKLVVVDIAGTY